MATLNDPNILLDACCFAHCFSKVIGKSWILIKDNVLWNSKPRKEMPKIELGYALTIYSFITRQEFCSFKASLIYNG
jgi:hypothetical protein